MIRPAQLTPQIPAHNATIGMQTPFGIFVLPPVQDAAEVTRFKTPPCQHFDDTGQGFLPVTLQPDMVQVQNNANVIVYFRVGRMNLPIAGVIRNRIGTFKRRESRPREALRVYRMRQKYRITVNVLRINPQ